MNLAALPGALLQGLLFLLVSPLSVAVVNLTAARLQGRRGPDLLQPYRDLLKLLRKPALIPHSASALFSAAPLVIFVCCALPGFAVPLLYQSAAEPPALADLLLLVYLLALARLMLGLGGMDSGAPFGGLGAAREMFLHALSEPTLLVLAGALALRWHSTNLGLVLQQHRQAGWSVLTDPALFFVLLALLLVTLAEAGRLPFDNPHTHLELTMLGRAAQLEYSGALLALLEWAESMRLTFFLMLTLNLFIPALQGGTDLPLWQNAALIALFPVKLALAAALLAVWEAGRVKLRLRALGSPALMALGLALIALVFALIGSLAR